MVRSKTKQERRRLFREKLFDLANYVAAALVFGQFVGQQPIAWTTELLGIAMWLALAAICYWLSGEK
jgi:hypothetical protein